MNLSGNSAWRQMVIKMIRRTTLRIMRTLSIAVVVLLSGSGASFGESDNHSKMVVSGQQGLRIYLPREIIVREETIGAGSIFVMRGDEKMVAKAIETSLGKFSKTGQAIIIDRNTILSRLASSGIKASAVSFSGADKVTVKRDEEIISGENFVEVARSFLKSDATISMADEINLVRKPQDWVLPDRSSSVKLVPRKSGYGTKAWGKVWVAVVKDGVETGGYELVFNIKYKQQRTVAVTDIDKGAAISSRNTKIETFMANTVAPAGWYPPYGQVARRLIRKGSVVGGNMTGNVEIPITFKRNQLVVIKIETPGISISNIGQVQSDARNGELVKVKVGDGRAARIIVGKVKSDGTIEPIF